MVFLVGTIVPEFALGSVPISTTEDDEMDYAYLVAGAAALAVLEQGLVAARRHGRERRQVHVLEPAGATCIQHERVPRTARRVH